MQIYAVRQGDSIFSIARAFGTNANRIIEANQLPEPNRLVIGQALVIPITGSFYYVQPGDTLYTIARRFGMSVQRLATINKITVNKTLVTGTRLYIPPEKKTPAEFNGYIEPRGTTVSAALENSARETAEYLTYLAPFSFQVLRNGDLREPPLGDFPSIAANEGTTLMMVLTNLENDAFSSDLGRVLVNDTPAQARMLDTIVSKANQYGFRDIHFDFENLRAVDREAYGNFLRRAKARFAEQGWTISAALAPKTNANQKGKWYEAHDYRMIGEIVDFAVIMTYEWAYGGGPAGAVSPIGPVRNVLEYAMSEMPAAKIMMGQNLYGYDWRVPFRPGSQARAVSPQQAIDIARRYNAVIEYDTNAQAPFFKYSDESGNDHEVWFEDARSIQAKFNLLKELRIRGMSYWKLGLSFPQNWLLLQNNFSVVKV